jgi:hypothetical protein
MSPTVEVQDPEGATEEAQIYQGLVAIPHLAPRFAPPPT